MGEETIQDQADHEYRREQEIAVEKLYENRE